MNPSFFQVPHDHAGQAPLAKVAGAELAAGLRQHLGGAVHPDGPVAALREMEAVPAGSARGVENDGGGKRIEQLVHHGFFERRAIPGAPF